MKPVKAIQRGDGKWNCRTSVPARQGYWYYGCSSPATADPDADGNPTKCATHSVAGEARRKAKRAEHDAVRRTEWTKRDALNAAARELEPALRKIAEGYDDARGLAQEVIAALDEARK